MSYISPRGPIIKPEIQQGIDFFTDSESLIKAEWWQDFRDRFGAEAEASARERFETYRAGPAKAHWPPSVEDLDKICNLLIANAKSAADPPAVEGLPKLLNIADVLSLANAAWEYAFAGVPVFPLKPGTKEPLPGSHGFKDATTDLDQIMKWWQEDPTRNIGISPGDIGCCVVECERDSANDVTNLATEGKILPRTCEVRSASGGRHLWLLGKLGTGAKKLAPTIDHRGDGGYVVVPPSIIDERDTKAAKDKARCGRYTLSVNEPLSVLPAWVAERLNRPAESREANGDLTAVDLGGLPRSLFELANETIASELARNGKPVEGEGSDDRAYRLAARLGDLAAEDQRLSTAAVASLMHEKWAPHFDFSWLLTKARNAVDKYRQNGGGCDDPAAEFNQYITPDAVEAKEAPSVRAAQTPRVMTDDELQASDFQPPKYLWENLVLQQHVNLLYGDGKVGKTMLALHLALAIAAGMPLFGRSTKQLPVLMVLGEDDFGAVKASRGQVAAALGITGTGLNIRYICRPGEDLTIAHVADDGTWKKGDFAKELTQTLAGIGDECVLFLDNAGIVGDLNENFRRPVHTFLRRVLGDLMQATGCTPIVLAHPTSAGIKEGGTGGSRAWRNATRNLLSLARVDDDNKQDPRRKLMAGGNYGHTTLDLWMEGPVLSLAAGRLMRANDELMGMLIRLACAEYDRGIAIKRPRSRKKPQIELGDWQLQEINDALGIDLRPAEVYRQLETAVRNGYLRYVPYVKHGPPAGYTGGTGALARQC